MNSIDPSIHYSIFNNYEYSSKNKLQVFLDRASTPVRLILGGRNINLLNCEEEQGASTTKKVLLLALSIIFFPVGLISSAALLLKTALLPHLFEKPSMIEEYKKTQSLIQEKLSQSASDFLNGYVQYPILHTRKDIKNKLFSSLQEKVQHPNLEEVTFNLFSLLSAEEKITLIVSYVKNLYHPEDDMDLFKIDTTSLIVTIHKLYPNCPLKEKVELFEKIVRETCRINESPNYLYSLFKADLFFDLYPILLRIKTELKVSEGESRYFADVNAGSELEEIMLELFYGNNHIYTSLKKSLEEKKKLTSLNDLEELKAFYNSKKGIESLLNSLQSEDMPYPTGLDLDKKVRALFNDLKIKSKAELLSQHAQVLAEIQSHRQCHQVEMSAKLKIILARIKREIDAL